MRRVAHVVFIVVIALTSTIPASSATPVASGPVTGTFEGTSVYELFGSACPVIHQVFTGTYDPDRSHVRNGTYEVEVCVEEPNEKFEWLMTGTFEIVTGNGFSLRGTVTGAQIPNDNSGPILATLTVTESPGLRDPLLGTITIDGISDQSYPAPPGTSVEHGTFSAELQRVRPQ